MKKFNVFSRLLIATMMCAPFSLSAQVTIGSGALPQATLDIVGSYSNNSEKGKAFRLDDGNQADGKVLTVDGDNAVATWQYPALTILPSRDPQPATAKSVLIKDYSGTNYFMDTDDYIDLEPGRQYMIIVYMPVWVNFSLEALESLNYRVGLMKPGGEVRGVTIHLRGPYRGDNTNSYFDRQMTMVTLSTLSNVTTTRYYVGYGGFTYWDANGANVTFTHPNAATNRVSFVRSGIHGYVYAIPMTQ